MEEPQIEGSSVAETVEPPEPGSAKAPARDDEGPAAAAPAEAAGRRDFEAALEAILFVTGEPVSTERLLAVFDEGERSEAAGALERLRERYRPDEARGVFLEEVAGGFRIVTAPECHPYLKKFFEAAGANRLSMAALETLAIVAYRQPITGPEIQELRGKNSAAALKTLLERRMLRISGRKEVVGRPFLYATTRDFLMHFGLRSLTELPPLEEFEEAFGGGEDSDALELPPAPGLASPIRASVSRGHASIGLVSAGEAEEALGVDDGFEVRGEALASAAAPEVDAAPSGPEASADAGGDAEPDGGVADREEP